MRADTTAAASVATAVRWGRAPHTFELRSSDAGILARAADVFRPWECDEGPTTTWTVVAGASRDEWTLSTPGSSVTLRGDSVRAVTAVEFLALERLLGGPPDVLGLHGALVARDDRGILILGPSGAGKSTLACALWLRGWSLLGDDVTLVDSVTAAAWPAPRRVSLRRESRELLGEHLWTRIVAAPASEPTTEGYIFHPDEVDDRPRLAATRLGACLFLARNGAGLAAAAARHVRPGQAALALLPYSNLIGRHDAGSVIGRIAPLATAVPAYDLQRGPLQEMTVAVERLLGQTC